MSGRIVLLLAGLVAWSSRADSTVVFNEIMYHPAVAEPDFEWIELHNQMAVNMDLSGWALDGGIGFKFPEGTVLAGGGNLVVALNPAALIAATGATNVMGPFTGRLSNSGEKLELRNNNQRVMDQVKFGTDGDWPIAPDGTGVSLAKRDPDLASSSPENWRASAQIGGTPGTANFPSATAMPPVLLISSGQEWRFDNSGMDMGTAWRQPAFDDSAWASAGTPLYGGDASPPSGVVKPIPGLFNTGVGADGQVLSPGTLDGHYVVTLSAEPVIPAPPAPALVIEGHPAWLANDAESSWLGPVNPGTANVAAGNYRCRTSFDLKGFDPTTANLTLAVSADNRLNDVLLNGASTGLSFVGFNLFSPDFTITHGFVAGTNTLEFLWANDGDGPNPAGIRAKLSGSARTLAAPASRLSPVRLTAYARRSFVFSGNPAMTLPKLHFLADDGAVLYLNGVEALRLNLADGPVAFSTPALTNVSGEPVAVERTLPPGLLRVGTNLLAMELHQAADGLNDLWFDLDLSAEPVPVAAESGVVFNEIGGAGSGFFVELANRTSGAVSVGGYELVRQGQTDASYVFPADRLIPAGGYLAVTRAELPFQPASGDQLVLFVPGRGAVADAVKVKKTLRGRLPDATGDWAFPARATPGTANQFLLHEDVVINEIMYHPSAGSQSAGSWIELYNRGKVAADLTDWRFDTGIDYQFAAGLVIPPDGYLVVAERPDELRALHPGITIVGPYTNSLSHRGELLVLKDAAGNPADQVHYFDGGRWPAGADGGGSSLELRNPLADHAAPEAWAASRESAASGWSNYTYRAVAAAVPGPTRWNEFVLGLLGAGECLIDDLQVVESPGGTPVSLLQNGDFENGAAAWRFLGTHRHSRVIVDPDNSNNHVLDLIATGPTEHMHNHLETTLVGNRAVVNGREYQVSFRAKWLAGDNQLNTRLYFNRVARTTRLAVPSPNGTPGAQNSTYEANLGPTFAHLRHLPVVPAVNQPVVISVEVADPQGIDSARLYWSKNGGAWQNQVLPITPDGLLTGTIPGAAAGTVVQFYVQATDALGASASSPARGPDSRALYIVNDQRAQFGKVHNLRLIMTPADNTFLHADTNVMSNESLGATLLYDEAQVFYDVGVHLQGSERGRPESTRVGFTISFPPDQLFRGVHDLVSIDRSGGYTGVGGDQDEIVLKHALQHAGGLPGMYDDLVRIIPARADLTGPGLLLMAKYGDVFLDSQFTNGSDGGEFKLELAYYPTTTVGGNPQSPKLPQPDEVLGVDLGDLGNDPEVYRWFFLGENNHSRDDYGPLMTLAKALSKTGAAQDVEAHRLMDVSMWMRAVAFQSLWGEVDTYPFDNQHNFIVYFRPDDGRALPFLWDMDFDFGAPATSPLNRAVGNLGRLISLPGNQRLYLGHMLDIIDTTYNTNYLTPWIAHYGNLVGENFSGIRSYIDQRVKFVRSQLPAPVTFAITSNGGQDFLVNATNTTISGRAWINVKDIALTGRTEPLDFKWPSLTSWQVPVSLILGTNRLEFRAFDFQGNLVGSNSVVVTSTAVGGGLDTDSDGMPDAWEVAHGSNPQSPDADLDPDGDGFTNEQEYLAGTDPADASSRLELDAHDSPEGIQLSFLARAGRSYTILGRDLLNAADWQRLGDVDAQSGDHLVETVDANGATAGNRYYRLVTPRLP